MSMVLTMSSILIGLAVTAGPGVTILGINSMLEKFCKKEEAFEPMLTKFSDGELLEKTLCEHGFQVIYDEESIIMVSPAGKIKFYKESGQPVFSAVPIELTDTDKACEELDELNEEYMENVQTSTYNSLKAGLEKRDDLYLEDEQILEDNTILITLTVR